MYYEEIIIEGVLHVRGTPKGKWRKLTAEEVTLKYMEAKRESAQHRVHPTPLQACVCGETKLTVLGLCASCGRERG